MAGYNHTQTSSSASWSISHGLSTDSVVVDVMVDYNGELQKILPKQIEVISSNQIAVIFESAQTGSARVFGDV